MFSRHRGVLVGVRSFGLRIPGLARRLNIALWSIIAVVIWQFSGYSMVIFLAGLQGIPAEVLEAAEVDGAQVRCAC